MRVKMGKGTLLVFTFFVAGCSFLPGCSALPQTRSTKAPLNPSETPPIEAGQIPIQPPDTPQIPEDEVYLQMTPPQPCDEFDTSSADIKLAFSSGHDGNDEIYVLDLSNQSLQRLTNSPAHDDTPIGSPDGSMIAFLSDRSSESGLMDIYVVRLANQESVRITENAFIQGPIAWSPEGDQIAYVSAPNGYSILSVVDVVGGGSSQLPGPGAWILAPLWSPDGEWISFLSNDEGPDGYSNLYLIHRDGTDLAQLTTAEDIYPYRSYSWSPDGSSIIYSARRKGTFDLFKFDLTTMKETQITTTDATDLFPMWSSDGQFIAYQSAVDGNADIYIMDPDGDHIRRLTSDPSVDQIPTWSEDSRFIAFITWADDWQSSEIRVSDIYGCKIERVTRGFSNLIRTFSLYP